MKQSLRLGLRALVLTSLFLLAVPAMGQNIQLHYDLGRYLYPKVQADRPRMTMTVEQQSLDRFGDTFYFVDMSFLQQGAGSSECQLEVHAQPTLLAGSTLLARAL